MEDNTKNKETTKDKLKSKNKIRMILVIAFILLFLVISYISLRGSYLEYKELGENYEDVFFTNIKYRYTIIGLCFVIIYTLMYFINRGIKKGLKVFFEKEKIDLPKLPNKSISLIVATILSVIIGSSLMQKVILYIGNTSFGITDPIFNMDIAYYMFQKPLIEAILIYVIMFIAFATIYCAIYVIIAFNKYFDGIDKETLKTSLLLKKLIRNIRLIAIGIALLTILNTQNILFEKMLTINEGTDIIGAGYTQSSIKLWGYAIFAIVIVIAIFKATSDFGNWKAKKVLKNLAIIPGYLVVLFIAMVGFDAIFVNSNKLDKEKDYLQYNIDNTKNAYNINIEENNLSHTGTITSEEVNANQDVIKNVTIVSQDAMLKILKDSQTETGHYSYRTANIAKYKIDGEEQLVYVAPREITNKDRTYNNKTYEYTHGMGEIIAKATTVTESGTVEYVQKDIVGKDNKINVTEPRMYFGLEVEDMIATNVKNKQEYDYTDEDGNEVITSYSRKSRIKFRIFR